MLSKVALLFSCFLLLFTLGCQKTAHKPAEKGAIELPENLSNPIVLNGVWEFYPSQLIEMGNFENHKPYFVKVPATWNSYSENGKPLTPNYNCATFRLRLIVKSKDQELGLIIPKIWTSNRVFANGELISQSGQVACSKELSHNVILEKFVKLPKSNSDTVELVIHSANFDFFIGGIIEEFWIGSYQSIYEKWNLNNVWALMWIGCLILMFAYHLILYVGQKENESLLYFSGICFLIALRYIIFGDHFIYAYLKENDLLSASLQPKIYYSTTFILAPLGLSYVLSLYKEKWGNNLLTFSYVFAVLSLIPLIVSYSLFFKLLVVLQLIVLITVLIIVFIILKAVYLRKSESLYQFAGIIVMVLGGINDSLHANGINLIGENEMLPLAFGAFLSLQIFVLAKRFSDNFNQIKDLSVNLEKKVAIRTQQLQESQDQIRQKNEALQETYQSLTDSLRYAKRIQDAILGQQEKLISNFKDGFLIFYPRDIVSGDFYWHARVDHLQIVAAADCTGHGVPGAFMTLIGNDALDEIIKVRKLVEPAAILAQLDKRILETLHQNNSQEKRNEGMDIALVVVDELNHTLSYCGAKNPIFFVSNGTLQVFKSSKYPIGSFQYNEEKVFETQTTSYQNGDKIYLFSDGYQDQFGGEKNRKFMSKRFREFVFELSGLPMAEQKQILTQTFHQWKDQEKQTDDVLVMGITL